MTEVHHQSAAVHLPYHLLSQLAHSAVSVLRASCAVADVVVAVVTQGDIHHSSLCEMLHVAYVAVQRQSVLYAEHYRFASVALVGIQVSRSPCYRHELVVCPHYVFNLVEDEVGIFRWRLCRQRCYLGECLSRFWLWQICRHRHGALSAVCHLVQVNEDAAVSPVEVYSLWEEHRCVAMRVDCHHLVVQSLCLVEFSGTFHEPSEERQSVVAEPFRMPLHSEDALVFAALHSLYHPVFCPCRRLHPPAAAAHGLVVE